MSAECRQCGHDVYADEPCVWCEIVNERDRYLRELEQREQTLRDVSAELSRTRDALNLAENEVVRVEAERDSHLRAWRVAKAQRDRYRRALEQIAYPPEFITGMSKLSGIARAALNQKEVTGGDA